MKLSTIVEKLDAIPEGTGFLAHCPAHTDRHRSLRVDVNTEGKLLLNCRAGCAGTRIIRGLPWIELDGIEIDVDGAKAAGGAQAPVSGVLQAQMAAYLRNAASNSLTYAIDYAWRRFGISTSQFVELGLGYDGGGDFDYSFLGSRYTDAPRLVVPFRDHEGVPRGFQARDISPEQSAKAKWSGPSNPPEGGSWTRVGYFKSGSGIDFVVITEGPGDALTSVAAGIDAVGIRGVSHAPAVVDELASTLAGRRIVLAGDNDRAGQGMNNRLGDALTDRGLDVYVLELPIDVNDLSEWYESSPSSFSEDYQRAVMLSRPYVRSEPVAQPQPVQSDTERHLATNVGAARRVVELFNGGVAFTEGLGFMIYQDGCWIRDAQGNAVRRRIHSLADEVAESIVDSDGDSGSSNLRRKVQQTYFIDSVIKEIKAMVPVEVSLFDRKPELLSFRNGVVDLRTGELLPHSPDHMLTHRLELDYEPEAQCPRWDKFLMEIMKDNEAMVSYLQRLVGYGVTGMTTEQCFAVLWGTGANGKSVFTDTLSHVFDSVTVTTPFSTFEERNSGGIPNDVAALRGSRLVFASEGDQNKPMAEAIIKRLTGQDLITARFMREEFFSFRPTFLIMLATNYKPNFKGQDEGLWRRVKLIPFSRYFPPEERDLMIFERLKDESAGIAAWAVRGAMAWFAGGLQDPSEVVRATQNYRDTSDALSGFFPDGPLVRGSDTDFVLGSDAYKLYEAWCDDEQLSNKERWSRRALFSALEERGALKIKRNKGVGFLGVKKATAETVEAPAVETTGKKTIFGGAR